MVRVGGSTSAIQSVSRAHGRRHAVDRNQGGGDDPDRVVVKLPRNPLALELLRAGQVPQRAPAVTGQAADLRRQTGQEPAADGHGPTAEQREQCERDGVRTQLEHRRHSDRDDPAQQEDEGAQGDPHPPADLLGPAPSPAHLETASAPRARRGMPQSGDQAVRFLPDGAAYAALMSMIFRRIAPAGTDTSTVSPFL
jgi:hypothetical protein